MDFEAYNRLILLLSAAVLTMATLTARLRRWSLPLPLVALLVGALAGPALAGFAELKAEMTHAVLEEGARMTLAIGLMGIALRVPCEYWKQNIRFIALILTLGMLLMWTVAAGVLYLLLPVGLVGALLLGAILTPTDPIVSTPIVSGPIAEKNLPDWLRNGISAESGSNDGLGFLFVVLGIDFLVKGATADTMLHWVLRGLLYEIICAALIGAALGWAGARLLHYAEERDDITAVADPAFSLTLPVVIMTFTRMIGADGILAAFVGGVVYSFVLRDDPHKEQAQIQEMMNQIATVGIFLFLGLALPVDDMLDLGWIVFFGILLALILRRVAVSVILGKFLRSGMTLREIAFLGWFGPVGVAALYYVMLAQRKTGRDDLFPYIALAIVLSVVLHGVTSVPLSKWLGKHEKAEE